MLICFFLPWIQVSCGGVSDALSGMDLARHERFLLWLVPLLMLAVLAVGLLRVWREQPKVAAHISTVCGAVTALLMNRERMRVQNAAGLISAQLTGWFWLSLIAAFVIVATGIGALFRPRATQTKT